MVISNGNAARIIKRRSVRRWACYSTAVLPLSLAIFLKTIKLQTCSFKLKCITLQFKVANEANFWLNEKLHILNQTTITEIVFENLWSTTNSLKIVKSRLAFAVFRVFYLIISDLLSRELPPYFMLFNL